MSKRSHSLGLSSVRPDRPRGPFPLRLERASARRNEGRLAWIVLFVIIFSLPFIKEGHYSILVSAMAAVVACLLALASVGYSLTSFISIVALTHLLFYPLAAWGNLLLPFPAVRWDLWVDTDLAMWGCTAGVLALALGAFLSGRLTRPTRTSSSGSRTFPLPSFKFNLVLALLIVPVFLALLFLGVYFHGSITDYSEGSTIYMNLLTLATFISHSGIFLQTYRYTQTRSLRDGYWAIAFCVFHIVIFMPSGSRVGALQFTPLLFLAYLSWESRTSKKLMVILGTLILLPALIYGIGKYRSEKNVDLMSLSEKFDASLHSPLAFYKGEGETDALFTVIRRFSDYGSAGRIIKDTPNRIPYRGAEELDKLWQIFVPGFLQILQERINLDDGAVISDLYGVTNSSLLRSGSAPAMIIGDLFSRWGWGGIVLGMAVIGFILRQIDLRMLGRWDTFTVIFYLLFGRHVVSLVSATLVNVVVLFSRELFVMALVAYALARLSNLQLSYYNPHVRFPVSKRFSE
jgi:hypothetical protein